MPSILCLVLLQTLTMDSGSLVGSGMPMGSAGGVRVENRTLVSITYPTNPPKSFRAVWNADMEVLGATCNAEFSGRLTVVEDHGRTVLVSYTPPAPLRPFATCPPGTLFRLTREKYLGMEDLYERMRAHDRERAQGRLPADSQITLVVETPRNPLPRVTRFVGSTYR